MTIINSGGEFDPKVAKNLKDPSQSAAPPAEAAPLPEKSHTKFQ